MEFIEGATKDLATTEHLVNLKVVLIGDSGVKRVDYRRNPQLLAAVGRRVVIRFQTLPTLEVVGLTSSDVSYTVRAVHYNRASASEPSDESDIAAIPGSVELVRSQLINQSRAVVGAGPSVTNIIKPNPVVGHSPCLDIGWSSLGTSKDSRLTLVVHCVLEASGSDLPDY